MDGASFGRKNIWQVFLRKTCGEKLHGGNFSPLSGVPGINPSIACGNELQATRPYNRA